MNPPSTPPPPKDSRPWQDIVIYLLIIVCVVLVFLFGIRLYQNLFTLRNHHIHPGQTDVNLIQGWMTVPYIAEMYTVPEDVLWKDLAIPPDHNQLKPLSLLEREFARGKPGAIEQQLKQIIQTYQAQYPPPPRSPTPTQVSTP